MLVEELGGQIGPVRPDKSVGIRVHLELGEHLRILERFQPSTKTRVDVGIRLKGREAGERLEASGSFNAMVSHRVRVTAADQVDQELIGWLREAYDAA